MSMTTRRPLRRLTLIAMTAAAGLALTACAGAATPGADGGDKDYSQLALASSRPASGWDPAMLLSALEDTWQWSAVYDTLLHCGPGDVAEPGAAESFEVNDDNTQLTLTLREGMTFEDGVPIDAAAAKASIEHSQNGGGSIAGKLTGLTIDAPDESTVVITSPTPKADLASTFCKVGGIVASPAALSSADVAAAPISSGPYAYDPAASTSGSVLVFEKRDDFWDADSYPFEKLVINVMPDVTARLNALTTGQIDGAVLNLETLAAAEGGGVEIMEWPNAINGIVIFDRNGEIVPALGDVRVRQALNMVFDREAIATGLFQSKVTPTEQMFGAESSAYLPELDGTYEYDLKEAKKLMADAGYPDGFSIQLPSRSPQTDQMNPLIIQQFGELGITVQEAPLAAASAVPELLSGKYPMTYISMPLSAEPVGDVTQSMTVAAPWNPKRTDNPEITELAEQMQSAQGEEFDRIVQRINEITVDEAWFIPWNYRQGYFGTSNGVSVTQLENPPFQMPELRSFS